MSEHKGLKNHEIAQLVNTVTAALRERFKLPDMTRAVVSAAVCDYLRERDLMIDSPAKQYNGDA